MKAYRGRRGVAPPVHSPAMDRVHGFTPGTNTSTYRTEGWVGPRSGLEIVEKRQPPWPCLDSNSGTSSRSLAADKRIIYCCYWKSTLGNAVCPYICICGLFNENVCMLRSALLRGFTQRELIVCTDVSEQPIRHIFKDRVDISNSEVCSGVSQKKNSVPLNVVRGSARNHKKKPFLDTAKISKFSSNIAGIFVWQLAILV